MKQKRELDGMAFVLGYALVLVLERWFHLGR